MVMLDFTNSRQTSSAHFDDPSCYDSTFTCQKKKKCNTTIITERETKYLYEKTELETITRLFVSIDRKSVV